MCALRSLEVTAEEGGPPHVRWAGRSRWLEVSIGLIGEQGAMRALTPTVFAPLKVPHPCICWIAANTVIGGSVLCVRVPCVRSAPVLTRARSSAQPRLLRLAEGNTGR
jgi:hypothetical protein